MVISCGDFGLVIFTFLQNGLTNVRSDQYAHFCILILFSIYFQFFYLTISDSDYVWQIRDKKLINKGTGREYSCDTSKQGYNLDGVIIEERYIVDYLNTAHDQWKFCHEEDETFKIKCTSSGSFLRAKSDNDENHIIKGNFSFLLIK